MPGDAKNQNIMRTWVTFLNSLIRSRLSYWCHEWHPTNSEMSKLSLIFNHFFFRLKWLQASEFFRSQMLLIRDITSSTMVTELMNIFNFSDLSLLKIIFSTSIFKMQEIHEKSLMLERRLGSSNNANHFANVINSVIFHQVSH